MNELIKKSAKVEGQQLSDTDLKAINRYTLRDLTADEVFAFKVAMCDNAIDRDHEVMTKDTLQKLADLYRGKTVLVDHEWKTENQCARIYETYIEDAAGIDTGTDETYCRLMAKCYLVRKDSNIDMITDIEAGIRKEVSVGFRVGAAVCSICGADQTKVLCEHMPGQEYNGETCYFALKDPQDAYEVSFVAVPAQPRAGTTKTYGGVQPQKDNHIDEDLLALEIGAAESFIFAQKEED